jgi:RNase H-like domain found in reverse transcriptase
MKDIIAKETLLAYPDFNKPFEIHMDGRHTQLGAVVSQDKRPIAFYSRKLNPAQTRYTVGGPCRTDHRTGTGIHDLIWTSQAQYQVGYHRSTVGP